LQTNSGPKPFSEPETQAVRDLLKEYKPNMYLSIHSGSAGLYTPHAYSMDERIICMNFSWKLWTVNESSKCY
jgi:hypothetical protein